MKKVYCCKEGGKRFGKTCLTNGCRGSNGFCQYASELTKEEAEATAERVRKALKGE